MSFDKVSLRNLPSTRLARGLQLASQSPKQTAPRAASCAERARCTGGAERLPAPRKADRVRRGGTRSLTAMLVCLYDTRPPPACACTAKYGSPSRRLSLPTPHTPPRQTVTSNEKRVQTKSAFNSEPHQPAPKCHHTPQMRPPPTASSWLVICASHPYHSTFH